MHRPSLLPDESRRSSESRMKALEAAGENRSAFRAPGMAEQTEAP